MTDKETVLHFSMTSIIATATAVMIAFVGWIYFTQHDVNTVLFREMKNKVERVQYFRDQDVLGKSLDVIAEELRTINSEIKEINAKLPRLK